MHGFGYGFTTIGKLIVTTPNCMGSSGKRRRRRFAKKTNLRQDKLQRAGRGRGRQRYLA